MTNLDSVLKNRDITLLTVVHIVKVMVFPVIMYSCESWTVKKAECWRIEAFKLWCWKRILNLESFLDSKEIKSVNLKGNYPWILIGRTDTEAPILWLPDVNSWLIKTTWCWERLKAEEGDRRWRGWMASPMQWLWTWANSRRYWGKGKPCMLRSMELQRVGHNWATEHNNLVQTLS